MKITLHGTPTPQVAERLEAAGAEPGEPGELHVVVFGEDGRQTVRRLVNSAAPVLVLADALEDQVQSLASGATAVLAASASPELYKAQLLGLRRFATSWQRRLSGQQRRAKRAMDDLASTQDLLGRLIDATPNPVMASDLEGRVLVFNRAAETALGYEARWAREHMHVTDVYADPSDARRVLGAIRGSSAGLISGMDARLRTRWGEHLPVLLSAAEVYDSEGEPMATVGVFQDMREQLSLADRLEETTEQLIESEKRAAAIELAGATAHELNQPLTAVMGSLELLDLRDDVPDDAKARLRRTYKQLERMGEIVRALARTSRAPRAPRYSARNPLFDMDNIGD